MDRLFADPNLAEWYDVFCAWDRRDDFSFYFPLVMAAEAVLDVGCGTGLLLRRARAAGHRGRLCGLDPAAAMLDIARNHSAGVEWLLGDLASFDRKAEFDLVVMTGHAFQMLVSDTGLRTGLAAIRAALTDTGRFAFGTRNPLAREWARWTPENAVAVTDSTGRTMRMEPQAHLPVNGDLVSFSLTFTDPHQGRSRESHSTLRFLDADSLTVFLAEAGLAVQARYGDWNRTPLTATGPEIITIAGRT